jgi:hypothetical protein
MTDGGAPWLSKASKGSVEDVTRRLRNYRAAKRVGGGVYFSGRIAEGT